MTEQYHEVAALLRECHSQYGASACQGVICGVLVHDDLSTLSNWIEEVLQELDVPEVHGARIRRMLTDLAVLTRERLEDPEMSFELLLPEEEHTSLELRAASLSDWCQGLLYGLSLAGVDDNARLPGDSSEIINDVVEISRIVVGSDPDETDEVAYCDLVEYLRVAVLLLLEEFQTPKPGKRG